MLVALVFVAVAILSALWLNPGPRFHLLQGHRRGINVAAFSPDGMLIATGSDDRSVRLWSSRGTEPMTLGSHTSRVPSLVFGPRGDRLFSGDGDGTVRIWDVATRLEVRAFDAHEDSIEAMVMNGDGTRLYTVAWDSKLKIWDPGSQQLRAECELPIVAERCVLLPDESALLTGCIDGRILKVVLIGIPKAEDLFDGHCGAIKSLCLSADGSLLASASADRSVTLWNLQTGAPEGLVECPAPVFGVRFSSDQQQLLCGTKDGRLLRLQLPDLQIVDTIETPFTTIRTLDHDGNSALVAGGYKALAAVFSEHIQPLPTPEQPTENSATRPPHEAR